MVQMYGKYFKRRAETESFSRAEVDEAAGTLDIVLGELEERGPFPEILAEETVGVLDGAFFPGVVGFSEEGVGTEGVGDFGVAGKFATVVESDGFQDFLERGQLSDDGGAYGTSLKGGHQFGPEERDDGSRPSTADDSVDLNVARTGTLVDNGGTHGYVHAAGYEATVVVPVGPLLPFPTAMPQVVAQMAVPATPVVDPAVEGLVAHHVDAFQPAAPRYLLRAPQFLLQFLSGKLPHLL